VCRPSRLVINCVACPDEGTPIREMPNPETDWGNGMSTVRVVPLGASAVAGLWVGGEVGAVVLAVLSVLVLLLVARATHFRLTGQDRPVDGGSRQR
jgi:hypothetical protein